jgi:hypothetical protein
MKNVCALIPLLVALPVLGGCAGTKPVESAAGEGGSGATGATTGAGGSTGSGGSHVTGSDGNGTTATGGNGGGGGDVGPETDAGMPICGLFQFQPTPKAADIMMVLDRSGSMTDAPEGAPSGSPSKWTIVTPALMSVVTATQGSISWGLKTFPEATTDSLTDCAGGITSVIDVQVAPMDGMTMNNVIAATTANGSGTPTADAITAAATYLGKLTDNNPKYLLLATDGEPDCVGTTKESGTNNPADTAAVTAVGKALMAGFPTFVVGIVTSKDSATTELNNLATAGGEALNAGNPLSNSFYETDLASNSTAITQALQSITGQISTCLFPLSSPPPVENDGTKVGVYLGASMTRIPYDATMTKGWAYTDTNDTAIQVYGSWCDMIQAAGAGAVQIIYGCANILPPG